MGMVVQHNLNALGAYNKLNANVAGMKKSSEKLSSGYRINRAGDDAAGLAISEKMRSQIKGLNQAIRNSQDGISMIQTFEGAAQETHAILQRMKELATESANGTYDNATDRAAIELEFNQLNDELNQIADTDFNGTIVLNGGEMADGLTQVNDEFDYANKKEQLTAKVTEMLDKTIADATKALNEKQKVLDDNDGWDLSDGGKANQWQSVDNALYDKTQADNLWQKLCLTDDGTNAGAVDLKKGDTVEVTFTKQTDGTWKATSGTVTGGKLDEDGSSLTADQLNVFKTKAVDLDTTNVTGAGGFMIDDTDGTSAEWGNAIFDAIEAKEGDTVTLVYKNAAKTQYAPENIGFAADSVKVESTGTTALDAPTVELSGVKDADMTQKIADAYNNLRGVEFKAEYGTTDNTLDGITIGGAEIQSIANINTGEVININGTDYFVKGNAANKPTELTISTVNAAGTGAETELMTITITAAGDADETKGSVSGKIELAEAVYEDPTAAAKISVGDDKTKISSNTATAERDAAKDALAAANAKKTEVLSSWENIKNYFGVEKGVSIADSYDNSTARMTYADSITLQTGARTKDSVNFTFNYNQDGSADMGDLKANLNLSARADGLNTENLSLATQDDANYAIDQIDKAINKTSMVRASFGSIQNRLEHKITNLTTTSENLTAAESTIRDTDMASEMMNYTKFNILQQAAQSMLAQANQQPQSILQLLG